MSQIQDIVDRLTREGELQLLRDAFRACGVDVNLYAALRWARSGRLEALKCGGRWKTNINAVKRFLTQQTNAAVRRPRNAPPPATSQRSKAVLARHGLSIGKKKSTEPSE